MEGAKETECAPVFTKKQNKEAFLRSLNMYKEKSTLEEDRWQSLIDKAVGGEFPRNAGVTTVAPTGNTGYAFDTLTGGAEPVFSPGYRRKIVTGEVVEIVDTEFAAELEIRGIEMSIAQILDAKSVADLPIPKDMKRIFAGAHDIHWKDRVDIQAALQKFCTSAISGTVNIPEGSSVEEIMQIYQYAYKTGCKGITVYRDKSRDDQIIQMSSQKKKKDAKRPVALMGRTLKAPLMGKLEDHNVYTTINEDADGDPVEIFIVVGNSGSEVQATAQAIGRLMSKSLQYGMSLSEVASSIVGIKGELSNWVALEDGEKPVRVESVPDLVGRQLMRWHMDKKEILDIPGAQLCPMCQHRTLISSGGCWSCGNEECGYSRGCTG